MQALPKAAQWVVGYVDLRHGMALREVLEAELSARVVAYAAYVIGSPGTQIRALLIRFRLHPLDYCSISTIRRVLS